MKIAMIICNYTDEVIWNAFRLANIMLEEMDDVSIFLNGPSVNYESLHSSQFPLLELAKIFTLSEGQLFAWGKLMDLHGVEEGYHKRGTQKELYQLIKESDKVLAFWSLIIID